MRRTLRQLCCPALLLAPLALATPAAAAKPSPASIAAVDRAGRASLPEYLDFLRLPNVTLRSSAEIRANADWLQATLTRHGWKARQLPDGDTPMLFAEMHGAGAGAPTILFYAHMDGQPVDPKEWKQADPFVPVLRRCDAAGACSDVPLDALKQSKIDPELRIFARSAADDKAPIMMLIAALDAIRDAKGKLAVNVKLIVDSHEEGGPATLADVVAGNKAALAADAIIVLDGPMHPSNRPTVVYGYRGGGVLQITVFGPRSALHSGHFGNYVSNPAQSLVRLVDSLKDATGKVTIPGFYDGATTSFRAAVAAAPVDDDEVAMLRHAGVASHESFVRTYREAMALPSLNLIGLQAGTGAAVDRSIIPDKAVAAFDLRTVPGISFDRQLTLIRSWVRQQGYYLIEGAPTDLDRQNHALIATVTGRTLSDAFITDPATPVGRWVAGALHDMASAAPVAIPIMGGSVPTAPLSQRLDAPLILLPLVNADDNQHAPDENLRVGNYFSGISSLYTLLTRRF